MSFMSVDRAALLRAFVLAHRAGFENEGTAPTERLRYREIARAIWKACGEEAMPERLPRDLSKAIPELSPEEIAEAITEPEVAASFPHAPGPARKGSEAPYATPWDDPEDKS